MRQEMHASVQNRTNNIEEEMAILEELYKYIRTSKVFHSPFRNKRADTRGLETVPRSFSLQMAELGLKPRHLILKHSKGTQCDS